MLKRILRRFVRAASAGIAIAIFGLAVGWGIELASESKGTSAIGVADSLKRLDPFGIAPAVAAGTPLSGPAAPAPPGGSARRTPIVDVAQRVSPAVVSIGATKSSYERRNDPMGFDMYFPLYQYSKREFPYLGSGFIIDKEGHVLTNYHVVENSTSISVTLPDRRSFSAKLIDADTYVDIALLQLQGLSPGGALPTLPMGNSDGIMIGETVLAIGNPFGPLIGDPRPSVSAGVVSATDRSFKPTPDDESGAQHTYRNMIQSDAAINPGNSGGPLVNLDGEAIAINTFIFSNSGDSASVGFSIPINRARKIAEEILRFGRVRAIRMDMEPLDITPSIRQWLQLSADKGALIKSLEVDGPGERAGLQPGDVVVAADGAPINDAEDLMAHVMSRNVGDSIRLKALRKDKALEFSYTVAEAPRPSRPGDRRGR